MAGNKRRAKKVEKKSALLVADGEARGPELPATRPDGEEWLDITRRTYEQWRRSPQAILMGTEPDWLNLLDLMFIKDLFYRRPSAVMAAEIRMREAQIGATIAARRALKFDAPEANDLAAGGVQSTTGSVNLQRGDVSARALGLVRGG